MLILVFSGIIIYEVNGISYKDIQANSMKPSIEVKIELPEFNEEVYLKNNKIGISLSQFGNIFILSRRPKKVVKINTVKVINDKKNNNETNEESYLEPPPIYFITGYRKKRGRVYLYIKNVAGKMKKVYEGSKLEDGYVVKKIEKYKMIIQRNGIEHIIEKH